MAAFWITQNKTFEQEAEGGFLWAPLLDRSGKQRRMHAILAEMKPGDLVLSYVRRHIVAIGFVVEEPIVARKPLHLDPDNRWQRDGWFVSVRFTQVAHPVDVGVLTSRLLPLLPDRHAPLNRDGTGAQGYAYHLPPKAEALLLAALGWADVDEVVEDHLKATIPESTSRLDIINARIGQGVFRDRVLDAWGNRCAVTGMAIRDLVRASHIKPWRTANNRERLDPRNGLALSPNYDAAFDRGIVSFADDGRVLIGPSATRRDIEKLGFRDEHRIARLTDGHRQYLHYHQEANGFR